MTWRISTAPHALFILCVFLLATALSTKAQTGYNFVPVAPCRIADTRNPVGPFGGPTLPGDSTRSFTVPGSSCGIPSTAAAYSLNVTVVPSGALGYISMWPTGQAQPLVSTLNSLDGRVKANAAIVPAGTGGAVSVFASDATNVILDINGYFAPTTVSSALAFYPVTPCRVADTRNATGALGGPSLVGGEARSFPVLSACSIPSSAQAYSLNFTAIPQGQLGYLSVWPAGQTQPLVSTLNALTGTITANAAIVPAGTGGAINLYASNNTDLIIDINGYFAPAGPGGLSLYTLAPCRVLDTRQVGTAQPFGGDLNVSVARSGCGVPVAAQAYVFNATVVPPSPLGYLTLFPEGTAQPLVSTLNATDGAITSNMAIVPAQSGSISAYTTNTTQLLLDISSYFATRLSEVRSYVYWDGETISYTPGIYSDVANSLADLIILGGGSGNDNVPLNRTEADPTGTKLIFGYVDVCEAAPYSYPSLFASGTLPSWFGNVDPTFPFLYSVQYWNPAWEPVLFQSIDEIVANGYDGIFLDVLSGDNEWSAGNPEGNPVYPDAVGAMAALVSDIRNHIITNYPGKTVYLIGNNPSEIASANPRSLKNLDAILNEVAYYVQSPTNYQVPVYIGTSNAAYITSTLAPLYETADVPIFGNDYPNPLTDAAADLLSFNLYSSLGWIPSVGLSANPANIVSTGPFMFMATPSNSTVTGYPTFVNFLSGGIANNAILIGGNQGDYFIGGPGQNAITAGAGNDTIYAHPANANQKGQLVFSISATFKGTVTAPPSVSISVNGQVALQPTQITAVTGTSTQTFDVNASGYSSISSVETIVTGTSYIDQNDFSNVEILQLTYNGVNINLTAGIYSNGSGTTYYPYSNNGTVTLPGSLFAVIPPFPSNTSDVIDGGGGTNSVIYRAAYSNYTVGQQTDGSWLVTSKSTAEGPDKLTNIQILVFSDQQLTLP